MGTTKLRPNFTGTWRVNFEKSVMRVPLPKQTLVKIEHREPVLIQEMVFANPDGSEQRLTFTYETNVETANLISGTMARTRAWWDGMEFVIETKLKRSDRELHFRDHWSISEDGKTFTMAHRDDDLAGQITVLEIISQDTPTEG
jgi:hypothetical protein